MSVFSRTLGCRGEDTSTEILAHLLVEKPFEAFQKHFFLKTCGEARTSEDLNTTVVTQPRHREAGIPDALILTNTSLILLENKLGSPLSGSNQLLVYLPILEDDDHLEKVFQGYKRYHPVRRILLFLAPRVALKGAIRESDECAHSDCGKTFAKMCEDKGVTFLPLAWEDVGEGLNDNNALEREVRLYVEETVGKEMTMQEIECLKPDCMGTALEKLFGKIASMQQTLNVKGYKEERLGHSLNYYGFRVGHERIRPWFGYSLPKWTKHKAPVILQLREEWIMGDKKAVISAAKELGFIKDKKHEWLLPFPVGEIGEWDAKLRKALVELARAVDAEKEQGV